MSRVSATFSGFIVAFILREVGVGGVFGLITAAMVVVIVAIAMFGPNVREANRSMWNSTVPRHG
jgi:MFS transporter, putative metabolite:H+ symporter